MGVVRRNPCCSSSQSELPNIEARVKLRTGLGSVLVLPPNSHHASTGYFNLGRRPTAQSLPVHPPFRSALARFAFSSLSSGRIVDLAQPPPLRIEQGLFNLIVSLSNFHIPHVPLGCSPSAGPDSSALPLFELQLSRAEGTCDSAGALRRMLCSALTQRARLYSFAD